MFDRGAHFKEIAHFVSHAHAKWTKWIRCFICKINCLLKLVRQLNNCWYCIDIKLVLELIEKPLDKQVSGSKARTSCVRIKDLG